MNKIYVLGALILIVCSLSFSKKLYHGPTSFGGIVGQSVAGCTCHGAVATPGVSVNLTGVPANPVVGNTYDLILSVSGTNPSAGFNLAVDAGALSTAMPNDGAQLSLGELTHTSPKALVGGTATWNVKWTPDAVGSVNFTFAGNNVNNSFTTAGDFWNIGSVSTNIILPVTLTSFNASSTNAGVKLTWKVEKEINLKQYLVEKSFDGIAYEPVGVVLPTANNIVKDYSYIDATVNHLDMVFYRLKIVDLDASFKYSPVVAVPVKGKQDLPYAFPNPIPKNSSAIKLYVGKTLPKNIQLYDNNGLLIYTNNKPLANENEIVLPTNIKPGNYYFKINYGYTNKIVRFIVN